MELNIDYPILKGFKLISLKLTDFSYFGTINYEFIDYEDAQNDIYTTVIIGPNGTLKSQLFNLIIYIFKTISDLNNDYEIDYKIYSKGSFHIKYSINNNLYEVIRTYSKDNKNYPSYKYELLTNSRPTHRNSFPLPKYIIGNSINITDKFPYYSSDEFDNFKYIGLKRKNQFASTKSYIRNIIEIITKVSFSDDFIEGLRFISETFGGKDASVEISYKIKNYSKFFNGRLTIGKFNDHFKEIEDHYNKTKKQPPFSLGNFKSIKKNSRDDLNLAIEYCNNIWKETDYKLVRDPHGKILRFNISEKEDLNKLGRYGRAINVLYSLNLIIDPKLEIINHLGEKYSFETSSSGEHNLYTSLIGLLATIEEV